VLAESDCGLAAVVAASLSRLFVCLRLEMRAPDATGCAKMVPFLILPQTSAKWTKASVQCGECDCERAGGRANNRPVWIKFPKAVAAARATMGVNRGRRNSPTNARGLAVAIV